MLHMRELENVAIESIQNKAQRENNWKKNEQGISDIIK